MELQQPLASSAGATLLTPSVGIPIIIIPLTGISSSLVAERLTSKCKKIL